MSEFEDSVIDVMKRLRVGDVMTYGEVAAEAGHPGAARAVGSLLRTTTEQVPWWRVVGSGGVLRAPDRARQERLLADEGVDLARLRKGRWTTD